MSVHIENRSITFSDCTQTNCIVLVALTQTNCIVLVALTQTNCIVLVALTQTDCIVLVVRVKCRVAGSTVTVLPGQRVVAPTAALYRLCVV